MRKEQCIKMLEDHLLPLYEVEDVINLCRIMPPCHKAGKVMYWLSEKNIQQWPGNFPDLNPSKTAQTR